MNEYLQILNEYSNEQYLMYSKSLTESEWGNMEATLDYLKKYYIPLNDHTEKFEGIQNSIFYSNTLGLPDKVFKDGVSLHAVKGGILFEKVEFERLQNCIRMMGDESLIIIQNDYNKTVKKPLLRMKYPVNVTWSELMSGNFVSTVLFEMFANEYFVFSESGNWGKYSANDYDYPLDIIGFKPEFESVFTSYFTQSKEEHEEIYEWLPELYKKLIKSNIN